MSFSKLILSAVCLLGVTPALASAPMATTGNPGYYRFHVGNFEVNVISDGTFEPPMAQLLTNISHREVKAQFAKNFLDEKFETSVDTFLINTGSKLVLVDTGAGTNFGPTVGHMLEHMKAAGYTPEQVDVVLITHMHGDHIGGLVANGKRVFPNATLYIGKADVDYWLDKAQMEKAPADKKAFFQSAMADVNPYIESKQLKPLAGNQEIVPGIRSIAAHGHTPGHTIYSVESAGHHLLLIGDLIHVAAVQFEKPEVAIQFDSDQEKAEKQREKIFVDVAKKRELFAGAHLPFPGVGHIRAEKRGYSFVPINYTR